MVLVVLLITYFVLIDGLIQKYGDYRYTIIKIDQRKYTWSKRKFLFGMPALYSFQYPFWLKRQKDIIQMINNDQNKLIKQYIINNIIGSIFKD